MSEFPLPILANNIALVLSSFFSVCVRPKLEPFGVRSIVEDDQLTLETSIAKVRAEGKAISDCLPLLAFKRDALMVSETLGQRGRRSEVGSRVSPSGSVLEEGKRRFYDIVEGELNVQFVYYANSVRDLENFEISYVSHSGMSKIQEWVANFPEIGEFRYAVYWNNLESKSFKVENTFMKSVVGSCMIRGWYFIYTQDYSQIWEIVADILSKDGILWDRLTIVPN